jgi:hypothetical protein
MRTVITIIFILSLLTNCTDSKQKAGAKNPSSDTTKSVVKNIFSVESSQTDIDSTIVYADSAKIKGEFYIAFYKTDDVLYVVNSKGDTVLKASDLYSNFEFDDFNADGFKDIRIHYMSNVPVVQDLLLFDKTERKFKLVDDFSSFPDPNPIKGTKYYYSYHRSGCADMNWDSDLFYLASFKAIRIGNISGYECENRDIKNGIYIRKIKGDQKTLQKTIPINILEKYKDYKWGFIKDYWTKNYKRFF